MPEVRVYSNSGELIGSSQADNDSSLDTADEIVRDAGVSVSLDEIVIVTSKDK